MRAGWRAILNWRGKGCYVRRLAASLLALTLALPSMAVLAAPVITPSGPSVPENLLRVELHLSQPLTAPLDMRHVVLLDTTGGVINDAFLDVPLADPGGMSVSILLHPGRIKSGVGPNVALGPALRPGETVVLRIDDPQLDQPVEKHWLVKPALREAIDLRQWTVRAVKRGGMTPLVIVFPSALDGDSAALIGVQAPDGHRVEGRATLSPGEREWRFKPSARWLPGRYVLRVHSRLEDPQGNRLCSAFEQAAQSSQSCSEDGRLEFVVEK